MSLDTNDYFVKQISYLSKGGIIVASVKGQLNQFEYDFIFIKVNTSE